MKILKLSFENLNSLQGRWEIDFSDRDFTDAGIFAITGPTGAGKSTILDAICLALYGRSPRLESISQSANEIMSKGSARCGAEVLFEAGGSRYLCTWSQRRARGVADGKLQSQSHELARVYPDDSAELITKRIDEVKAQLIEVTGMDFTRFTRSMLLAQGNFAAFLHASPDEKAPILEQITGTELYSDISKKVHEIHRREEASLLNLRGQLENEADDILSQEEVRGVEEQLDATRKQVEQLTGAREIALKEAEHLRAVDRYRAEIERIKEEQINHSEFIAAFEADRLRLEAAKRALKVSHIYEKLQTLKRDAIAEKATIADTKGKLEVASIEHSRLSGRFDIATKEAEDASNQLQRLKEVTGRVREIDRRIADLKERISKLDNDLTEISQASLTNSHQLASFHQELSQSNSYKVELEEYLNENRRDQQLKSELPLIQLTSTNLSRAKEKLNPRIKHQLEIQSRLELASSTLQKAIESSNITKEDLGRLRRAEEMAREDLNRILAGKSRNQIELELEELRREILRIGTIEELQQRRSQLLIEGESCPLCGSIDHPFSVGVEPPNADQASSKLTEMERLIEEIEDASEKIEELEVELRDLALTSAEREAQLEIATSRYQDIKSQLEAEDQVLEEATSDYNVLREELKGLILPYLSGQIEVADDLDFDSFIHHLSDRSKRFFDAESKLSDLSKAIDELRIRISRLEAVELSYHGRRQSAELQKSQETNLLLVTADERLTLFGERDPDQEEQLALNRVEDANRELKRLEVSVVRSNDQISQLKGKIENIDSNLQRTQSEITITSIDVTNKLTEEGFADEGDFLSWLISQSEVDELEIRKDELASTSLRLSTQLQGHQESLAHFEKLLTTDESLEEVVQRISALNFDLNQLRIDESALIAKMEANERFKARYQMLRQELEAQQLKFKRWQDLDRLIGSADGKKYRNFVQTLTFESLVRGANRQLQIMSDRYLLAVDNRPERRLTLNVIDNFQAGEVRTTKNLSGGESFIVSLALALGLSAMLSGKMSVDSLFLDEGFGTLDEEALEAAIDALSSLQAQGKVVGIISHVQSLKDRISTQITVTPMRNGLSSISGPGCKRL